MGHETASTNVMRIEGIQHPLVRSALVIVGTYAIAEIAEINRFLHIWVHGEGYWCYQGIFFAFLWAAVSYLLFKRNNLSLPVLLLLGSVGGFGIGLVSLSLLPLFIRFWSFRCRTLLQFDGWHVSSVDGLRHHSFMADRGSCWTHNLRRPSQ